ncbi:hypothetical protein [Desulfitobacterium hafniense]|uniref:hypothetical protein n=1 Tax=Desulfitobacterium hafniense TaxID=49338 RepID=UPI00036B2613|nr:hypothetical protein [Desulfitobacterium hafniense]
MAKKYFTKTLLIMLLSTLVFSSVPKTAYADEEWQKPISGQQVTRVFYILEDPIIIPSTVVVSGAWREYWKGTPLDLAVLQQLNLSATVHNKQYAYFIDTVYPDTNYYGASTDWYGITYPGDWGLHPSTDMYTEGYNYPWKWYNTYNLQVDGNVNLFSLDALPMTSSVTYRWYIHY